MILIRERPRTNPWATPRFIVAQSLQISIIFALCLWFFELLIIRLQTSLDIPYALSLRGAWGIVSKAMGRSIATVPTVLPLSKAWRQYSVKCRITCRQWWVDYPWWRHQMETFSALLALCVGNSPVSGEFPTQRPVTRSFDVFFLFVCLFLGGGGIWAWINAWANNREAGDWDAIEPIMTSL